MSLIILLIIVTSILFLWLLFLTFKVMQLNRLHDTILAKLRKVDTAEALAGFLNTTEELYKSLNILDSKLNNIAENLTKNISRIGVVKYDAFDGMGGSLSSSTALLNNHADGIVLTSIHGRSESRTYVKLISDGKSTAALSPEEKAAIQNAMENKGRV